MRKNKLKVCIIATNPNFLGGLSLYQKNLISFLKKKAEISWIYKGSQNKEYENNGIKYFQIKVLNKIFLENLIFEFKVLSFLNKNKFDIINSHGFTELWMKFFKRKNTKLVHTYHGSTYHFYKNHLKRFGRMKGFLLSAVLLFPYFIEGTPIKKADKIICVSEHVKKEMIKLYGKRKNIRVIRTGVDLNIFKLRNKNKSKEKLNLDKDKTYGLYVGRGGFWTKGLDKVIRLSKDIYNSDKNYKLLIIGADENKVRFLTNKEFVVLLPPISRDNMPFYYNASDIFFSMSRYEGGAPTLVTSEAMASGCLIITDKEANQEIIKNEKNGLIIGENYEKEAKMIINTLNNKKKINEIINNSANTIKDLSLETWGKKYLDVLLN